jgi:hypothetical protein
VTQAQYLAADREGDVYSVSDLALRRARERAKAERAEVYVLMDGRAKWCVHPDGAIDHAETTRPG